jgi:asparagine synthase (glutamine-hydrolysing)
MCGIAGMVSPDGLAADDRSRVIRMRDLLSHRGPDDAGLAADQWAALGHRRLSIVDVAGGAQPMANEDGTVWVCYNGEIYNHADIRRELEEAGHVYRTRSDTETVVHAYEQWGEDCVLRFRGMFAFAIWDQPRRRLLLVRDRLGIKPLYWTMAGDRLLFASEIKSLLESGLVPARANEAALPELLSMRSLTGEETMFTGITRLMPGHLLSFVRGRASLRKYWTLPVREPGAASGDRREDVRRFRDLLEESIRLRLMSDVPIGVFLSGGLDSSAIAALMAPMMGRPLETFSVAFSDRAYNELEYSREVARAIGARSHEVLIDDRDFFSALPRLIWHEDEPIAHPSSVPLHFVSALARRHVKVVLTGEGSDELLAGYGRYPRALLNWQMGGVYERAIPGPVRRLTASAAAALPGRAGRYARRSFLTVDHAPDLTFFDNFAAIGVARQRELLSPRLAALSTRERAYGPLLARFDAPRAGTAMLDRLLSTDMSTYLVELLMKQDQMSMSASVESRVPFLDHHLVEFAAGLPRDRKLTGFTTKRILRDAVSDVVPRTILDRSKMGFPVPFGQWIRGGWEVVTREVLFDRRSRERDLVSLPAVNHLLEDVRRGVHGSADAVWSLVNLELWYRTFIDGDGIQTLPVPSRTAGHSIAASQPAASYPPGPRG